MVDNTQQKLFTWSPEKIRWYADACEYSGNDRNEKLAKAILESLPLAPHICDIGCGIGGLSLQLAKNAKKVTAVDVDRDALDYLRNTVTRNATNNIEIVEGDFETLESITHYADCLVFCMVGDIDFIKPARNWTDGKVVFIIDGTEKVRFASNPKKHTRQGPDELRTHLKDIRLKFEELSVKASFGQPLANMGEAIKFISSYDHESTQDEIRSTLESRLISTGRADFPLYLPNEKEYAMFIITF